MSTNNESFAALFEQSLAKSEMQPGAVVTGKSCKSPMNMSLSMPD